MALFPFTWEQPPLVHLSNIPIILSQWSSTFICIWSTNTRARRSHLSSKARNWESSFSQCPVKGGQNVGLFEGSSRHRSTSRIRSSLRIKASTVARTCNWSNYVDLLFRIVADLPELVSELMLWYHWCRRCLNDHWSEAVRILGRHLDLKSDEIKENLQLN